jgi:hypothetical protein
MSVSKEMLLEQMDRDAEACVGCGATDPTVETVVCSRCAEDMRSCINCAVTVCDYCRHMTEKDD